MRNRNDSTAGRGAACALVTILLTALLRAQAPGLAAAAPGELRIRTERAVVFKDGYALLVKEGRGTVAPDGTLFTREVPDSAVLGSFWASCAASPIRSMRAEWIEESLERAFESPCLSVRDLLAANAGREVTLTLQWPEERQVTCRILGLLEHDATSAGAAAPAPQAFASDPSPWLAGSRRTLPVADDAGAAPTAGSTTTALTPVGGQYVAIELPGAGAGGEPTQRIVPVADVRSIAGTGLARTCVRKERVEMREKRLTFVLGPEAAGREVVLRILYFTPGLRWIPTYRLAGELDRTGELELQAEILNELEDLDGAVLDLVVGVPSFRFGQLISPLSLERSLRNVLQQAAPQLMGQGNAFSNALFSQRSGELRAEPIAAPSAVEMPDELAAGGEQDMFVYTVPNLTLRRSARATVALWSSKLDLRHLYTFDVRMVRDLSRGQAAIPNAATPSPLELAKHEIWHQLEMRNAGTVPWTTGAALVIQGNLPLGQDLLTYTPVGGTTLLPITVAVDVRGEFEERQVSIEPDAIVWDGRSYARVIKRGILRVTNFKKEAVSVRIRAGSGGKVVSAEGGPQILLREFAASDWQNSGYDHRLNGHSDLTWNLTLEAGASREVSFEVEMFLR